MSKKIKIGIVGAAGYTGGELIRLLLNHPNSQIEFAQSSSNANNLVSSVHADLLGETNLKFSATHHFNVDVIFFCAGHGEAKKFVAANNISSNIKLIDIGNDFRLKADATINDREFIYGLPELQKEKIKTANNIANPGCFATAIQLGLLPLAKAGLLNEVYTTGITGSTGAGQSLAATSHFSWRANNIQAYKTLTHQHNAEILQSINLLQSKPAITEDAFSFVPWRGDFTRGIFISSQLKCDVNLAELNNLYKEFYSQHPFVSITTEPVCLKQVVNTNKCIIQLEKLGNKLVVHSVIDNLIKGASGQAIQNMNLMFGLEETTGLKLKASYF
ncbi:MAG: N-acetyl-gamma-glutamyl-phosphate reductase [Ferruginibacter sp.]|nr:N-acetyl-gamma-glutamyl-phosphate reductase [Ferruginibacter sp.]